MARLPRFFVPGVPLHVIQRGNNRGILFNQITDYNVYKDWLKEAAQCHGHLYLHGGIDWQYFNATYERTGTLWEGRYRATLIESEAYLLTCCRYIELNPVRAELARHPRDYRWSSYHYHAEGKSDPLLTPHSLYQRLGGTAAARQQAYRALFRHHLSGETLDAIREATNKAWVLGSDKFKDRLAKKLERRVEPLPRGRPSVERD